MPFVETRFISPTTLTTSAASALYTVPTGYSAIIKQLVVTNITATPATFTFYIGAVAAGNALFSGTSVAANDTVIINLSQVLSTGEVLRALASANSALNLTVSGVINDGPLASTATYIPDGAITTAKIAAGAVMDVDVNASAAIAYSKLNLTNSIITGDFTNNSVTQGKLASTLSGVTVTTVGNLSTAIPSPFEGQMSYLTDVDLLQIWNGTSWRYIASTTSTSGSVLQVLQGSYATQTLFTGSTFSPTGAQVIITPKSTSSKILVWGVCNWYSSTTNYFVTFNLSRNSSSIVFSNNQHTDNAANTSRSTSLMFLDSPASTSALTYTMQLNANGNSLYAQHNSAPTIIIAMEVAG